MTYNWNKIAKLSALGACCSLAVWVSATIAKDETSVLVKPPAATTPNDAKSGPVLPPPAKPASGTNDLFAPGPAVAPPSSPTLQIQPPTNSAPTSSTVKRPFMRPAQPREPARGQLTTVPEPMPTPAGPPEPLAPSAPIPGSEVKVRPTPPIVYDTDHDARKMYRTGQVQLVMVTQDPSDGCCYEIPLCIPACCVGEPKISGGKSLLGRGVVEYCWPCGFRAIVKFRHLLGDVRVDYEGD